MIKERAKIIDTVDDILEEIGLGSHRPGAQDKLCEDESDLLLQHMDAGKSYDLGALVSMIGLDSPHVLCRLVELEL